MKTLAWLVALLLGGVLAASAQHRPRADVFAGYSYLRRDVGPKHISMSGFNAEVAVSANPWLALVGDFSINVGGPQVSSSSKTHFNVESFLFGPQVFLRAQSRVKPFARVLFGGTHIGVRDISVNPVVSLSDTSFAWAAGGGVNVAVNDWFDFRALQADYIGTRNFGATQNNFRLAFGFNFHFGTR